mgnify:CR=1 FL=1
MRGEGFEPANSLRADLESASVGLLDTLAKRHISISGKRTLTCCIHQDTHLRQTFRNEMNLAAIIRMPAVLNHPGKQRNQKFTQFPAGDGKIIPDDWWRLIHNLTVNESLLLKILQRVRAGNRSRSPYIRDCHCHIYLSLYDPKGSPYQYSMCSCRINSDTK